MEVYLIRHTTPDIAKGVCYGFTDVPLASTFEQEWRLLIDQLPPTVDGLLTSPLFRCRQLASKLSNHYNLSVTEDDRLRELNFGDWEMQRWDALDQALLSKWMDNYQTQRCPGGESYEDLIVRTKDFLNDLIKTDLQQVVIVTHGGVIKSFDSIINKRNGMELQVAYGQIHRYTVRSDVEC